MIFSVLMYDVNLNLNLNPHSEQVFLRGYPGAKIDYIKERVSSRDRTKLIGLVLTLKYCYHVQRVAVLQILHRQWHRRRIRYPVDIPWFNDLVDTLNIFLRNYFKEDRVEGVQFWRHCGF
jgi:hypothetical protein